MLVSRYTMAGIAALAGLGFLALPVSAEAAAGSASKECSAQYQAAKKAGTLNGQKWPQFYSDCAAKMKPDESSAEESAAKPKKASKSDTAATKAEKPAAKKEVKSSGQQTTQQVCSEQYQAAKAAGTLGGKKWSQFYSDCAAGMKDGTSSAAATPDKPKAAKTTSKSASSGNQTTQQICSDQYQTAKTAGTLGGKKWSQFYSDCAADIRNDKSDTAETPDEPKVQKAAVTKQNVSTVDKNGKPLTPGQIAFRQRIHECSVEWQSDKAANRLQGQKWPQYWSACNTRLKQEN